MGARLLLPLLLALAWGLCRTAPDRAAVPPAGQAVPAGVPAPDRGAVPGPAQPDAALRRQFDLLLATAGDRAAQPPRLQRQVLALFDRYRAYRQALAALPADRSTTVASHLARVARLRARFFSPVEQAGLFDEQDRYDRYLLASQPVREDATLSPDERRRRLAALETLLPPMARAARRQTLLPLTLHDAEQQVQQQGGGPERLAQLRREMAGPDGAARLAALDLEQRAWQRRVEAYRTQRQEIAAVPGLDQDRRQARIAALRDASFDLRERLRLPAFVPDEP